MNMIGLTCFACGRNYPATNLINLCDCGKPLRVDYQLPNLDKTELRGKDLWRFRAVLPLSSPKSLGEGGTPLIRSDREGVEFYVKDEAVNPTGSFKSRGMAVAVAMAVKLGAKKLAVPSAGNAGGALAAYAALHGVEAHIFMPKDVPEANRMECELLGAHVTLVDGLLHDCAKVLNEQKDKEGWFDLSTLKEPYRVEGKKTMGYELAEQFGWTLPDVILYPTGGGTGLIGMGKAFDEMEAMGWIGSARPKMVSVQAAGCAPIVTAYQSGRSDSELFPNAQTVASGLRVARAIGDFIMLDLIRNTGGTAIAVSDEELMGATYDLAASTGVNVCPEGGACYAAFHNLKASRYIQEGDRVVLFNTGTGLKYREAFQRFTHN